MSLTRTSGNDIDSLHYSYRGTIDHSFATATIKKDFINNFKSTQNINFRISGGLHFIIYNIKVITDSETKQLEVREKIEAEKSHKEASKKGKFSIYASKEQNNDISFQVRNIKPKESFSIMYDISFTASLEDPNTYSFIIPSINIEKIVIIDYQIYLRMNSEILDISANSQKLKLLYDPKDKTSGLMTTNSDISGNLLIRLKESIGTSIIRNKINGKEYLGITALADLSEYSSSDNKFETVFIVDCSGSMAGSSINLAKSTLEVILKSIPIGSLFNIIRFGTNFESLFPESVILNKKNFKSAQKYITRKIEADMGGTDIFSPLKAAYSWKQNKGFVRQIFLITDGQAEESEKCFSLAMLNRDVARVFTLGIGGGVDENFIKNLAKNSFGNSAFVKKAEEISGALMEQLAASLKPYIENVEIHIEGAESIEIAPFPLPPLFDGELVNLFARVEGGDPTTVMIAGNVGDSPYEFCVEVAPDMHIGCCLDKQFAYAAIRDLEQRYDTASDDGHKKATGQRIVEMSLEHQILSKLTAFWTFVEREPEYKCAGALRFGDDDCLEGVVFYEDEGIGGLIPNNNPLWTTSVMGDTDDPFRSDVEELEGEIFKEDEEDEEEEEEMSEEDEEKDEMAHVDMKDSLELIIKHQEFEGYWSEKYIKFFLSFFTKMPKLEEIQTAEINGDATATLLALAVIQGRFAKERAVWVFVVKKATEWLESVSSSVKWNDIIQSLMQNIQI